MRNRFVVLSRATMWGALLMCGLGLYGEAQAANYTVSNLNDSGVGSLRQAVTDANATTAADTITFSVTGTITLSSTLPSIAATGTAGTLSISGPSAGITVSGNNAVRVFDVLANGNLTLDNLTVSGGSVGSDGGGIQNKGTLTVQRCTLSANAATSGDGAGISNSGTLNLFSSTLSGNVAGANGGGIFNGGTLTATNSTFSGNTASNSGRVGAAICNNNSGKTATFINCTLTGNTANSAGGGIYNNSGTLNLSNSIVVGNTALASANISGTLNSQSNNITSGTAAAAGLDPNGLQDNGGSTKTIALVAGGTAINTGNNASAVGLTTDQRGTGYARIIGGTVDVGAFEYNPTPNNPPTAIALNPSSIAENSAVGTVVGTLSTTDPDAGDTFTYAFAGGADDASFTIAGDKLKAAANFDYETKSTYNISVQSTDAAGASVTQNLSVSVSNANEAPTAIALTPSSVDENQAVGTVVGVLSSTDPDAGDTFTYALAGGVDDASFTIAGDKLETVASFDYETKKTYNISVQSTDAAGASVTRNLTINVTDVNEAPSVALANTVSSLAENVSTTTATKVADIVISDDAQGTNALSLSGTDAGSFEITGSALYLKAGAVLDYESKTTYSVTVNVDDTTVGATPDDSKNFTLSITNSNEAPTSLSLSNNSVAENAGADANIGNLIAFDPDTGDTLNFSLPTGVADNANFKIAGNALQAKTSFDYEVKNSYSVTVRVTDGGGLSFDKSFAISVSNANDAPTAIALNLISIAENSALGTVVGALSTTDQDAGDTFTYALAGGADDASFSIAGDKVKAAANFDYETKKTYSIGVQSTDAAGASTTQNLTVNVTDVNEAPVITSDNGGTTGSKSVAENTTAVTTVTAIDVDSTNLTYSINGGADADKFSINATSGALILKAAPDFEVPVDADGDNIYEVIIQVSDDGTPALSDTQALRITVTDVAENHAPTAIALNPSSIAENSAVGTVVGTLSTTDPDAGDTFTYTLAGGADAASFTIAGDKLKTAANFDYEAKSTYSISVQSTDAAGASVTQNLTITVSNANEAPTAIVLNPNSVDENQAVGTVVGTLSSTDPDAGDTFTYAFAGGADDASFTIAGDKLKTGAVFNFKTKNSYTIAVQSTDAAGLSVTKTLTVNVLKVNRAPVTTDVTLTSNQNQPFSGGLTATDADGDPLTYSLVSGTLPAGLSLDASSGVISGTPTNAGKSIVTFKVSDGTINSNTATATINVIEASSLVVTTNIDVAVNDGLTSLREAITYANAHPGSDTITFGALFDSAKALSLISALPALSTPIIINGPGSGKLTIKAGKHGAYNILTVSNGASVELSGLTLNNGASGIYNQGNTSVTGCILSSNDYGVFNDEGSVALATSTLKGNMSYGVVNFDSMIAMDSTLSGNLSYGVVNYETLAASNCTLSGNANGLYNSGDLSATNCTVSGNSMIGLANYGWTLLNNSLVVGNASANVNGDDIDSASSNNILSGTAAAAGLDPIGLKGNGGPTQTIALKTQGTAVNAGSNALAKDAAGAQLAFDQRGTGFPRRVSNRVDIGAYESSFTNHAPVANNGTVTVNEDDSIVITLVANDPDPADNPIYMLRVLPTHGKLSIDGVDITATGPITGRVVKYTPDANYPLGIVPPLTGPDSFKFKASDGDLDSNEATISIVVNALSDAPVAVNDSYNVGERPSASIEVALTIAAPGVLANDSDADGEGISVFSHTNPAHGALTINANGGFVYKPAIGYRGPDSFTYVVTDGTLTSNPATVSLSVMAVPSITSFTPPSGKPGDVVTINGTLLDTATAVQLNGTPVSSFTKVSATTLTFVVPANALTGLISVMGTYGAGYSTGPFMVAPRITNFTPTSGLTGSEVVISGANFINSPIPASTTAKFGTVAATVVSIMPQELRIKVPDAAVTGPISVTNAGGTGTSATDFVVKPAITTFTAAGDVGTVVTINGSGLAAATDVTFGGVSAGGKIKFTSISANKITVPVPAGALTGKISVATPAGTADSASDFIVAPRVTSFTPTTGVTGTVVTVTGFNLLNPSMATVGGVSATITSSTATSLTLTPPSGVSAQSTGKITVKNAGGTGTSATDFVVKPTITTFTAGGDVGSVVTINGTGFGDALDVKFNGLSVGGISKLKIFPTSIQVNVPAEALTGKISVATPAGTADSASDFIVAPRITNFTPTTGVTGTVVTVSGFNLLNPKSAAVGGKAATVTASTATSLTLTVPDDAVDGKITVTNAGGTGTSATDFVVKPAITTFTAAGDVGTVVTINGSGLAAATDVSFGGVSAGGKIKFTSISANKITVPVPAGALTGKISVVTPAGTANSTSDFIVAPRITSFTPNKGVAGISVTVTGFNLQNPKSAAVGGKAATVTASTATSLTLTVPDGPITGKITVTNAGGTGTSATDFVAAPLLTNFTPVGGAEGAAVTINGNNFTGATDVKFNGLSVGGATKFTVVSATQITTTVPTGALTGKISVITPVGTVDSATDFVVAPRFQFIPTPFEPAVGFVGTTVTLYGVNMKNPKSVTIGEANANIVSSTATSVTVTVPADAQTGSVAVTNAGGTDDTATMFFRVQPLITRYSPTAGSVGTTVTLTGSGFMGTKDVQFGDVSVGAGKFTVYGPNMLTAIVPEGGLSGPIKVIGKPYFGSPGLEITAGGFVVGPRIDSFSQGSGAAGSSVTVSGINLLEVTSATIGGKSAAINPNVARTANTLTLTVPANPVDGMVTVTSAGGTATSLNSFVAPSAIYDFYNLKTNKKTGAEGESIIIEGNGFSNVIDVLFGGVSVGGVNKFTVNSTGKITVASPVGALTGKITLVRAAGNVQSPANFIAAPVITSFSPHDALIGKNVLLQGRNLQGATIDLMAATLYNFYPQPQTVRQNAFPPNSDTMLTFIVTDSASMQNDPTLYHGPIRVTTAGGTFTTSDHFFLER